MISCRIGTWKFHLLEKELAFSLNWILSPKLMAAPGSELQGALWNLVLLWTLLRATLSPMGHPCSSLVHRDGRLLSREAVLFPIFAAVWWFYSLFFFFWTCFFEAPSLVHENFCHPLWSSQLKNFRPYLHSGDPGAVPTLYRWPLSFLRGGNFIKTAFPHLCEPWAASSVAAEGVEEPGGAPLPLGGFVPVLQTVARLLVRVQIVFRFLSGSMWLFSCILGERK